MSNPKNPGRYLGLVYQRQIKVSKRGRIRVYVFSDALGYPISVHEYFADDNQSSSIMKRFGQDGRDQAIEYAVKLSPDKVKAHLVKIDKLQERAVSPSGVRISNIR